MMEPSAETSDEQRSSDSGLTRRQMIGRTAAAGAVVWTAPVLLSSTAHAAGTLGGDVCVDGRPESLTYRYTPTATYPDGTGSPGWIWDVCGDVQMADGRLGTPPESFHCIQVVLAGPNGNTVVAVKGFNPAQMLFPAGTLTGGEEFNTGDILKPGPPDLVFLIWDCNTVLVNSEGGFISPLPPPAAEVKVHVSCSQPLCVGDTHGSFLVLGL